MEKKRGRRSHTAWGVRPIAGPVVVNNQGISRIMAMGFVKIWPLTDLDKLHVIEFCNRPLYDEIGRVQIL